MVVFDVWVVRGGGYEGYSRAVAAGVVKEKTVHNV